MKPFRYISLILIAILLTSCAAPAPAASTSIPTLTALAPASIVLTATPPALSTVPATAAPQPVAQATSRGDKLEASPPASVKLGAGQPVLVEFFRFTWTTCQQMAPMVHGLEAKYFGQVSFYFLDADDPATQDYQRQFGFQVQPYFILLDGAGQEITRWAGFVRQSEFETAFATALK